MMKFFWPDVVPINNWQKIIEAVVEMNPLSPFDRDVLSFLQNMSMAILKDHSYRRYPELIALAYWLRKAHLVEVQEKFAQQMEDKIVVARGTALHFAPSNVDTIFVYSWVLSMLAGNNNILRISGRKQEQTELLMRAIIAGLEAYPEVAKRTAIVTYDHDVETTQYLSERCHIRVIWGGDETVRTIRAIPLAPLASEIAFPDRFSLSVLETNKVLNATDEQFNDLIQRFYNDGFWFGQMACSSPRMVVWVGEEEMIKAASDRFWNKLDEYMIVKNGELSPALQVQKLTTGYFLSSKEGSLKFNHQQNFSRLKVEAVDAEIRERHCGGGFFVELECLELMDLIPFLDDKDQTLSYFGFTRKQLVNFAKNLTNRSIDRIVPVGQALDFEGVWDGYDLLLHFTREIVIR